MSSSNPYVTVSALSHSIQKVMGDAFGAVYVRGEISSLKVHTSGHVYLTLKDEKSVIDAIIWRGTASKLKHRAEEGLEVLCYGRVTTYPARSKYQLIIESFEPAGVGALLKLLEERKERLFKEGLFDAARKKKIPAFPRKLAVITSETGAVIQDILHRLEDRYPLPVMLIPVAVQGEACPAEVCQALKKIEALPEAEKPDVVIVARGGGSLEDLWGFNDEALARAVAAFSLPLISAVGHETDTTLIDYVSDLRAPTPTAAAELSVPVKADLLAFLEGIQTRLKTVIKTTFEHQMLHLKALSGQLVHPKQALERYVQGVDEVWERLTLHWTRLLEKKAWQVEGLGRRLMPPQQVVQQKKLTLSVLSERLQAQNPLKTIEASEQRLKDFVRVVESLAPQNTLKRGYAMVTDPSGKKVHTNQAALASGEIISVHFQDGKRTATVD